MVPTRTLSRHDAARMLDRYHFRPGAREAIFRRLGSVQYDPLKPMGRNPDLTLQARVPGYRIDDWGAAAYSDRVVYDAWDKQVCLVPIEDWPYRKVYHREHRRRWQAKIFEPHADAVAATLSELERRGPMATESFAEKRSVAQWQGSWYGPRLVKNVLRALWDSGQIVTYHRVAGRHVYALPEQVVPQELLGGPDPGRGQSLRYLIRRRVQTTGLLRPSAEKALWFLPCSRDERVGIVETLVAQRELELGDIEGEPYLLWPPAVEALDDGETDSVPRFIAPLDPLIWDRTGVSKLFGFDYVWEVYKPASKRTWGYYVLPVWWRGAFVARLDARLEGARWHLRRWWWEDGAVVGADLLAGLEMAFQRFLVYLGAADIRVDRSSRAVPSDVRAALKAAHGTLADSHP